MREFFPWPGSLVPKLRLGTPVAKLRFALRRRPCTSRETEFRELRSQTEFGNEGARRGRSLNHCGHYCLGPDSRDAQAEHRPRSALRLRVAAKRLRIQP